MYEINKYRDWGGDAENPPLSGKQVQDYIKKTFEEKIGYIHQNQDTGVYQMFADEDNYNKYLNDPVNNSNLILGEIPGEFPYIIEVGTEENPFETNLIVSHTDPKILKFKCIVKEISSGMIQSSENFTFTLQIKNGNITNKKTFTTNTSKDQDVILNINDLVLDGINNITIFIHGINSGAKKVVSLSYNVINLTFSSQLENYICNNELTLNYSYTGPKSGSKLYYRIDNSEFVFFKEMDQAIKNDKYVIPLNGLDRGAHYIIVYCEYTDSSSNILLSNYYYDEFLINPNEDQICISSILPYHELVPDTSIDTLSGIEQYVPYTFNFGVYSNNSQEVNIKLNDDLLNTYDYKNNTYYTQILKLYEINSNYITINCGEISRTLAINVNKNWNLNDNIDSLIFNFSALEKTNNAKNKDSILGNFTSTFSNFIWNSNFGWHDNYLKLAPGSSISIDYNCFNGINYNEGRTIILEWMSSNVTYNSDTLIGKLGNDSGGIEIYGNRILLKDLTGKSIETFYNDEELINVAFVICGSSIDTYDDNLVLIYVNGIASGCILSSNYNIENANINFYSDEKSSIFIRSIKVFNKALKNNDIVDNFILSKISKIEINDVYLQNDIYDNDENLNLDKIGNRIPYMIIKGLDVTNTVKSETTTDNNWSCNIEYVNTQNPEYSFTMENATLRLQGTSSLSYVRKNFRIYSIFDDRISQLYINGKHQEDCKYSFKKFAQPVTCWCLKADYAESSGTHNTGIARLWGDAFKNVKFKNIKGEEGYWLRTNAQKIAINNNYPYDVRTTIDGFPILLFNEWIDENGNTKFEFIGKYNFNNDKSTESVFGFTDIEGFDNSHMQCWEMKHNGSVLCNFTKSIYESDGSINKDDVYDSFEGRYLSGDADERLIELAEFSKWISSFYHNSDQEKFKTEKWDHLDVYKMAAYWCYLMRHAAADQFVKNAMFTSEDGIHYYFILYDNDTINGLNNNGDIIISPYVDRNTKYDNGSYVLEGHDSVLWNMLDNDSEFKSIVSIVDSALSNNISYLNAINMFDNQQANKWVERIYNMDSDYKYLFPKDSINYSRFQGKREQHRKWWLKRRFDLINSSLVSGEYKSHAISFKAQGNVENAEIRIIPEIDYLFGYGINNDPQEWNVNITATEGGKLTLEKFLGDKNDESYNGEIAIGDVIRIYGANYIKSLDLSTFPISTIEIPPIQFLKLKELILGGENDVSYSLQSFEGTYYPNLEILNVEIPSLNTLKVDSLKYLKCLFARNTNVTELSIADGAPIEQLDLPENLDTLNLSNINADIDLSYCRKLRRLSLIKCSNIVNNIKNKNILLNAIVNGNVEIDSIDWEVTWDELLSILNTLNKNSIKGVLKCTNATRDDILYLIKNYPEYLKNNNSLYIDVGQYFICDVENNINEGTLYNINIYSSYNLSYGIDWSYDNNNIEIQQKEYNLYTLKVREQFLPNEIDYKITINAKWIGNKTIEDSLTLNVHAFSYPESISISGNSNVVDYGYYKIDCVEYTGSTQTKVVINGDIKEYIDIIVENNNIQLKPKGYTNLKDREITGEISITLVASSDNTWEISATKSISLLSDDILVTPTSNKSVYDYFKGTYDTDGIGRIYKSQISEVTVLDIDAQFEYFHELKYFTSLTSIMIRNYSLGEISLPPSLENITTGAHNYADNIYITDLESYFNITFNYYCDGNLYLIKGDSIVDLRESLEIPTTVLSLKTYALCGKFKYIKLNNIICNEKSLNISNPNCYIEGTGITITHPNSIIGDINYVKTNLRKFVKNKPEGSNYWNKFQFSTGNNWIEVIMNNDYIILPIDQTFSIRTSGGHNMHFIGVCPSFEGIVETDIIFGALMESINKDKDLEEYNLNDFIRVGYEFKIDASFNGKIKTEELGVVEFNKVYLLKNNTVLIKPFDLILPERPDNTGIEWDKEVEITADSISNGAYIPYSDIFPKPFAFTFLKKDTTSVYVYEKEVDGEMTLCVESPEPFDNLASINYFANFFGADNFGTIICNGSHAWCYHWTYYHMTVKNLNAKYEGEFQNDDFGITQLDEWSKYFNIKFSTDVSKTYEWNDLVMNNQYKFQIYPPSKYELDMLFNNISDISSTTYSKVIDLEMQVDTTKDKDNNLKVIYPTQDFGTLSIDIPDGEQIMFNAIVWYSDGWRYDLTDKKWKIISKEDKVLNMLDNNICAVNIFPNV